MSLKLAVDVLDLSDERDLHLALRLAAWRDGYRGGHRAGYESGYRTGYSRAVADWKVTAGGMTHLGGPPFAQLDRRRYPPGGRLSWIINPACPPAARMTPYKLFRHLGIPAGDGWHQPQAGWREMDQDALAILHDLLHESGDGITIAHTHARDGEQHD